VTADSKPWLATLRETVASNPYFAVRTQDVRVTDGSQRVYHTIHFPTPAVGIVVRRGTDFLLIRQYRFIIDAYVWAIPSGGVDQGESLEAAARRELLEETGHRAIDIEPLLTCYASYGCSDQRFEIFLAREVCKTACVPDNNEVIESRWFTRDEVRGLIEQNGIVDNLSLSPLLLTLLRDTSE
jgi:ADP-ribose pyrophosphatase